MESGSRTRVFVRIRPPHAQEEEMSTSLKVLPGTSTVRVIASGSQTDNGKGQPQDAVTAEVQDYSFDGVLPVEATQKDVFEEIGLPLLNNCMNGTNSIVFGYGQTGSGKTHSLLKLDSGNDAGLLQRLIVGIYERIGQDTAHTYKVEVSALQACNEQVNDLLHPDYDTDMVCSPQIQDGGVIKGLTYRPCPDHTIMLNACAHAQNNAKLAATKLSKSSNSGHTIFEVRVTCYSCPVNENSDLPPNAEGKNTSITIVDLAGSEHVNKGAADGLPFTEATGVNQSLLAVNNVVSALAANKQDIPLSSATFTRLLKGCTGGDCKTVLLVCLAPEVSSETVSSLQFALCLMQVSTADSETLSSNSASVRNISAVSPLLLEISKCFQSMDIDLEEGAIMLKQILSELLEASEGMPAIPKDPHLRSAWLRKAFAALGKGSALLETPRAQKRAVRSSSSVLTKQICAMEASQAEHRAEQNMVEAQIEIASWRDVAQKAVRHAEEEESETQEAQDLCAELEDRLHQLQIKQEHSQSPVNTQLDELNAEVLFLTEVLDERDKELLAYQDDCDAEFDAAAAMLTEEKSQSATALKASEQKAEARQIQVCARLESTSAKNFDTWHAEFESHLLNVVSPERKQEEFEERERILGLEATLHRELQSAKEEGLSEVRAAQRTLQQMESTHTIAAGVLEVHAEHLAEMNSEQKSQLDVARQDVLAAQEATDRITHHYRKELAEARKATTAVCDLAQSTKQDLLDMRSLEEEVCTKSVILEAKVAKHVEEHDQLQQECGMLHKEVHSYSENLAKRCVTEREVAEQFASTAESDGRQASTPKQASETVRLRGELKDMLRQQMDLRVELDRIRQDADEQVMEARHSAAEAVSGEAKAASLLQKYNETAARKVQLMKSEVSEWATARTLQNKALKKIVQDQRRVTKKASIRERDLLEELSDAYNFIEQESMEYLELQSQDTELEESMQSEVNCKDDMGTLSHHSTEELVSAEKQDAGSLDMENVHMNTPGTS